LPCSDSLRPSHRLRRGAGAAGAQPPCDLGLCLAHRSQKRRARCLVRRNLQMTNDDVYPTGCAVHRVLGLSPVRLLGCPKRRIRPGGTSRRYAKRPWSRASLAVGWRALGDRTQRCRPFAKPSPPGDSGDVTACHAARFTESNLMSPFRSGPRSLSSPSTMGPGALAPMGAPAFSEFPRPGDPANRGAALAREPPSPSPLLSHALPREHDLNAIELRSARRSPLAGVRRRTAHEESRLQTEGLRSEHCAGDHSRAGLPRRDVIHEVARPRVSATSCERLRRRAPSPAGLGFRDSSRWAPAGVTGRKLRPEHLSSPSPHRPGAETPSDGGVEPPSESQSRACARTQP
jgi:hypothetical protein